MREVLRKKCRENLGRLSDKGSVYHSPIYSHFLVLPFSMVLSDMLIQTLGLKIRLVVNKGIGFSLIVTTVYMMRVATWTLRVVDVGNFMKSIGGGQMVKKILGKVEGSSGTEALGSKDLEKKMD